MNEYTSHYIDHILYILHTEYHNTIELLNAYLTERNFGMAYITIDRQKSTCMSIGIKIQGHGTYN